MNHFTFNGKSTRDFGLLVDGLSTFGAPSRMVEEIQIPGRNGSMFIDSGVYANYIARYTIAVIDDFKANAREIVAWLLSEKGYHKLADTYNPESYRLGICYSSVDYIVTNLMKEGQATIEFSCLPQRFLNSGDNVSNFAGTSILRNPTAYSAKPLIRAYGTGTFTVNGYEVTINSADQYTDIDCELMQAYKGGVNCNNNIVCDDFPILSPGDNTITMTGVTELEIIPRWWTL